MHETESEDETEPEYEQESLPPPPAKHEEALQPSKYSADIVTFRLNSEMAYVEPPHSIEVNSSSIFSKRFFILTTA